MMSEVLLSLDNISVRYGAVDALHDVSGHFHAGSLTAVAGPNGAGKSTLLKIIAGLVRPHGGRVTMTPALRGKIAYLPQSSTMQRDYPLTVAQSVSMGLSSRVGAKAWGATEKAQVAAILESVGLADLAARPIHALSGGQFQRMLFARMMLQDADLLLLDEPFAAVDAETTRRLMQILLDWHRAGKTIICVLHDLMLIHKYFPESFILAGKCMGRGHTHALFEQKLLSFDLDMAEIVTNAGREGEGRHDSV